ncbi:hypothetical protein A7U60_g2354 [Sanghuangporus baumii]|uniref:GDP/GTP exchange factor Sec2 N-terminal domain-containing protein n=1 Tax=Sanghuangporus baumii TaxID=108892 RepID=A0A9Q5I2E7_SANBA|nr:hypothetical protein A7U60_g2354 [Sanghuangporus baumii]
MLHFASPIPNNMIRRPQRSDSLQGGIGLGLGVKESTLLAQLPDELHDMRRVQAYGQEEDLKEALGKMIGRVEELSSMLNQAQKSQTEFETQLKLAKSNLQLALANNEMLEDALRRESAIGSKDVGWRRRSERPESRQGHHAKEPSDSLGSRPPSRQGSVSVQSTPTSEVIASPAPPESPIVKPATSPVPSQPVQQDSRFFRFRFGSSSASSSPNPNANAGPSRPRTPPVSAGSIPGSASRRAVDVIRERDASHLTSASLTPVHLVLALLPYQLVPFQARPHAGRSILVASTTAREDELVAELSEVRAKFEKVSNEKHTLEQEVEGLSQALFEEANKMVAQERIKCAEIEDELRQVRQEKEALKSAMRVIEQENERLKSPPAPESIGTVTGSATKEPVDVGEDDSTPQGSRPDSIIPARRVRSKSESSGTSSLPGSSRTPSLEGVSDEVERITRPRSTSSTRGFRQKSSSSERGWGASSVKSNATSPSYVSVPLPESASESNSVASREKVEDVNAQDVETKAPPSLLLTSPTLPDIPFEESPWAR